MQSFYARCLLMASLLLPVVLTGQTTHWFPDCNSIEVEITNFDPPCDNCYLGSPPHSNGDRANALFNLGRFDGNQLVFVDARKHRGSDGKMRFNNLPPGRYLVEVFGVDSEERAIGNGCARASNWFGLPIGCQGFTFLIERFTVEIGTPVSNPVLLGGLGTNGNGDRIYCDNEVLAPTGLVVQTNAFGGSSWRVDIDMLRPDGSSRNYKTTGWVTGEMPEEINLLTDVWRVNNTWRFWASSSDGATGTRYRARIVQTKPPCTGWQSNEVFFRVLPNNVSCRESLEDVSLNATLFPNPATDQIRVRGLESELNGMDYVIYDLNGRKMIENSSNRTDYPILVNDLPNGMYLLKIVTENKQVTKKFTVNR